VFKPIKADDFDNLKRALLFLHVAELKDICKKLNLTDKGNKGVLIARILHFTQTSEKTVETPFPHVSKAQRGQALPLAPQTLMLKGAYKNDLKTRMFFKQLIGEHFHFTAFAIDWLNERWLKGVPPTYQEFADMWDTEVKRRQVSGSHTKEEWAYINFTKQLISSDPNSTKSDILDKWKEKREKQIQIVNNIIREFM
jgi:hypothetical protein